MNQSMDIRSRGAFQDVITEACLDNAAYRASLLRDPRAVVERHLGHSLPDSLEIAVVADSADTAYVVVPATIPDNDELADDELEWIAGGKRDKTRHDVDCSRAVGVMSSVVSIQGRLSIV